MIKQTLPITENLVKTALNSVQSLLDLLNREALSLQNNAQAQQITEFSIQKRELVAQLDQFTGQLSQLLGYSKLTADKSGMLQYFALAQTAGYSTEQLRLNWESLLDTLKQSRTLNEQNGALIELLSRHNQRALQILKGKPQLTSTYGPDGCTRNELFSHTLISV